ncbi:MAG: cofactor-independent phosphoglycerate mutase [Clostridia bacterium]|nr:cofactor-independent phosphoglycerate mutase [Clostridia bacterium]
MKYIVMLGDGMADYPIEELGKKTILEYAKTPVFDKLAPVSEIGLCKSVPDDMPAGSDVANLSIMGYDPKIYHTGRSPLEALSIGVPMGAHDLSFRTNLVTLSDEENYEDKTMVDYSSDEISTEESSKLIAALDEAFEDETKKFYAGISYRHILLLHDDTKKYKLTPPHDISGKKIAEYLPDDDMILDLMKRSHDILKKHPVNLERIKRGLHPANSAWIWGEGKKPQLDSFKEKFGISGSVISAVDLIKGIGKAAGLRAIDVEGATGNIKTNFMGKAKAALSALLSGDDFVYIHIEAPDESGHRGELDNKIKSVEKINEVIGFIKDGLDREGIAHRILIMPDHPTPMSVRTHTHDAVPFMLYDSTKAQKGAPRYNETTAKASGIYVEPGYTMMQRLIKG